MQKRRARRVRRPGEEGSAIQFRLGEDAEAERISFLTSAISILKHLPRTGWVESGVSRAETVASHSYGLAFLTITEARIRKLDVLKAVEMALIHDLPESYVGDLTPKVKNKIPKKLLENVETAIIKQLTETLPAKVKDRWVNLHQEYLSRKSAEARLVHRLDKVDMLVEASWLRKRFGLRIIRFVM
ncbi:MAG: HD domain-containing protein [Candidatus Caldarchaeum sp.]|nr:HD domain-containing protein [Candidatus Caldarchaeum sp.]